MNFNDIYEMDKKSVMQTYGRFQVAFVSGKESKLYDPEGKEYIDFGSGIGVNSLGYCDPKWVQNVSEQAATLAHISNLYYNPVSTSLCDRLASASELGGSVFLANSGAESNEGAIKLVRKYSFDKYGQGRATVITLVNSFHGRTITTLAATGQEQFHNYFFPFTEGFKHVEPGDLTLLDNEMTPDVCGIVLEGVQGEGGILPLSQEYVEGVFELAKRKDILVVFDEVQTGMGRTGKFFSYMHFGLKPDVVTTAKGLGGGLPIGAVIASDRVRNVLSPGMHATTFGGNFLSCAGAHAVMDRLNSPGFLESVTEKGDYIRKKVLENADEIGVTEVRGKGLMIGIDVAGAPASDVCKKLLTKGLVILTAKAALRMLPPLVITYEEIDKGLDILFDTLREMKA